MWSDRPADPHVEFQYHDARYQSDTAVAGMWLFLATEVLFFGGLFLCWIFYRHQHPEGFAAAARQTEFGLGTLNTALLLTSSFFYACGLGFIRLGNQRRMVQCILLTAALGIGFLGLKAFEWHEDIARHLLPGAGFVQQSDDTGGQQLFWVFYYIGTGMHGMHMLIGLGLIAWLLARARLGRYGATRYTAIEVVGLYWSFVDIVWLILYPLIYLAGGAA